MSQPPQQDPIEHIESNIQLNALPMRPPTLQRADYRPEATTPDNRTRTKLPFDRLSLIVLVVIVIAVILAIVWVLHTGGFGTPIPPTPTTF